ncbi:hypothetical protein CCZ27_21265 [Thauera sinica]|nr:DUF493 family protein [Thauera sp. K11]ATE62165.1 hypothetical protein CCZ27_21265 [Thauera sp. K11]
MADSEPRQSLLEFPCEFPIKIMGARVDGFAQAVLDVVLVHAPDFEAATMEMRPSSKGNYLAITCTFRAVSQEQIDNLYRALTSHPMVKVVL